MTDDRRRPTLVAARPSAAARRDDLVAGYIPEVNILNGCNVVVDEGEFVGIIGPNGAGKSTFLKAVLGLCSVRSGTITFAGADITGHEGARADQPGASGTSRRTATCSRRSTVTENLEMGCFLKPSLFRERFAYVTALFPRLARPHATSAPGRCRAASGRWWR